MMREVGCLKVIWRYTDSAAMTEPQVAVGILVEMQCDLGYSTIVKALLDLIVIKRMQCYCYVLQVR